jgi:hypothetical protein
MKHFFLISVPLPPVKDVLFNPKHLNILCFPDPVTLKSNTSEFL